MCGVGSITHWWRAASLRMMSASWATRCRLAPSCTTPNGDRWHTQRTVCLPSRSTKRAAVPTSLGGGMLHCPRRRSSTRCTRRANTSYRRAVVGRNSSFAADFCTTTWCRPSAGMVVLSAAESSCCAGGSHLVELDSYWGSTLYRQGKLHLQKMQKSPGRFLSTMSCSCVKWGGGEFLREPCGGGPECRGACLGQ